MRFTAQNIFNKQERIAKAVDKAIVKEAKRWIKNKIKSRIAYSKDDHYISFYVDTCASAINYTYKEIKQPFYYKVIPYFQDKGFKVEIDTNEICTIYWSK
jgi:hypothetical protein